MARSKFAWMVTFDDLTTKYVLCQTIGQIAEVIDIDSVINIIRIELCYDDIDYYPLGTIDIKFRD